uniref:Uncharacterized protein n=1 Tax=Oryzias latipes TaxID=8090 RepID=A0A3B3IGK6_ORYLA
GQFLFEKRNFRHCNKSCQTGSCFIRTKNFKVMEGPSQSLELNPIENPWRERNLNDLELLKTSDLDNKGSNTYFLHCKYFNRF